MASSDLNTIAQAMMAPGKGLLAADESLPTIGKRFKPVGIPLTEEIRRAYRETLFTAPGLGQFISGVILFDETIRQKAADGTPFPDLLNSLGIIPGIKVDDGAKALAHFPGEKMTEGLDGLRDRFAEYARLGAKFAKWRAVISIGAGIPTQTCLESNAEALARYAALCQEAGLVPIVEPEVLMDGDHTIERAYEVIERTLHIVFDFLFAHRISLEGMILKPAMVVSGEDCPNQASVSEVADATLKCLLRTVPAAVPGIAFLSGGQSDVTATQHLNALNALGKVPWALTFSYGRALQNAALETWHGESSKVSAAQKALLHRARCNSAARLGTYTKAMEKGQV